MPDTSAADTRSKSAGPRVRGSAPLAVIRWARGRAELLAVIRRWRLLRLGRQWPPPVSARLRPIFHDMSGEWAQRWWKVFSWRKMCVRIERSSSIRKKVSKVMMPPADIPCCYLEMGPFGSRSRAVFFLLSACGRRAGPHGWGVFTWMWHPRCHHQRGCHIHARLRAGAQRASCWSADSGHRYVSARRSRGPQGQDGGPASLAMWPTGIYLMAWRTT